VVRSRAHSSAITIGTVVLPTACRVATNSVHGDRQVAQQELGDERSEDEEPHGRGDATQENHAAERPSG